MAAAFAAATSVIAFAGPLEDGIAAYDRDDYDTAMQLLRPLAEQGDADAENSVGMMYLSGHGAPENQQQAFQWISKAADQDNAEAEGHLGDLYFHGWGTANDLVSASRWYALAANRGIPDAQYSLGAMYENGFGVTMDNILALKWAIVAVSHFPDSRAEARRLAAVDRDRRMEAMTAGQIAQAQRLAAAWRVLPAQDGVTPEKAAALALQKNDFATAAQLYLPLANQGFPDDQSIVGALYATGMGVPQDINEGIRWFRLAAQQGDPAAEDWLGLSYEEGDGVLRDYRHAYMWYSLAARPADPDAVTYAQHRDSIASKMSAEDLSVARSLADRCIASGYQDCD